MKRLALLALFVVPAVAVPARGQDPSGPEVGAKVPALSVFVGTGEKAGETIDAAKARGAKPTVYLFVRADKWDRSAARYMKRLDTELAKGIKEAAEAEMIAVWLTDDVDKAKTYVPIAQKSLQLEKTTWTVFPGEKTGPSDWMINDAAFLTTVLVVDGKIKARRGHVSVGEADAAKMLESLGK